MRLGGGVSVLCPAFLLRLPLPDRPPELLGLLPLVRMGSGRGIPLDRDAWGTLGANGFFVSSASSSSSSSSGSGASVSSKSSS